MLTGTEHPAAARGVLRSHRSDLFRLLGQLDNEYMLLIDVDGGVEQVLEKGIFGEDIAGKDSVWSLAG